jgi:hypothetical protein
MKSASLKLLAVLQNTKPGTAPVAAAGGS